MKEKNISKKSAIDLTDLAIGIIVLGIVVSIGANILITQRDSRLTDLSTYTTTNETADFTTAASNNLNNQWFKSITSVHNSSGELLTSGNYTVSVDNYGTATLTNTSSTGSVWNVTYDAYNTSRADYSLANNAAIGIGEFGNWFKVIVIVAVAGLVLALIFSSFGRNSSQGAGVSY